MGFLDALIESYKIENESKSYSFCPFNKGNEDLFVYFTNDLERIHLFGSLHCFLSLLPHIFLWYPTLIGYCIVSNVIMTSLPRYVIRSIKTNRIPFNHSFDKFAIRALKRVIQRILTSWWCLRAKRW